MRPSLALPHCASLVREGTFTHTATHLLAPLSSKQRAAGEGSGWGKSYCPSPEQRGLEVGGWGACFPLSSKQRAAGEGLEVGKSFAFALREKVGMRAHGRNGAMPLGDFTITIGACCSIR
ncbi:MAG UNVERIFIED_CONTAM: hypothetical protein LVT10_02750 [Anaerolineae bacterium]